MSDVSITVEGLGKRYRTGAAAPYHRLSEVLHRAPRALWRGLRRRVAPPAAAPSDLGANQPIQGEEFWAVRDVSFSVREGEVLGIVGRNGAGKSTLLKLLSRITEPTTGRFGVRGRIGSLLEVGTGFHPELTGRENIFLSGTILGLSRREIRRSFDEIVAFAEIDKFLDTPVKRYSSGMYVRLGFAIAAHLNPEILIVDEVLAVGDRQFQAKCLGKMGEVAGAGRTVLFVSHNMVAVRQLTSRCIVLEGGTTQFDGSPAEAIDHYIGRSFQHVDQQPGETEDVARFRRDAKCGREAAICSLGVRRTGDAAVRFAPTLEFGDEFEVVFEIESNIEAEGRMGFSIAREDGSVVTLVWSQDANFPVSIRCGRQTIRCRVEGLPLSPGRYLTQVGLSDLTPGRTYDVLVDCPLLQINMQALADGSLQYPNRTWGGVQWSRVRWDSEPAAALGRRSSDAAA